MIPLNRWKAIIIYQHVDGDIARPVAFNEIRELHNLIEDGPNFYAIKRIEISPPQWSEPVTLGGEYE